MAGGSTGRHSPGSRSGSSIQIGPSASIAVNRHAAEKTRPAVGDEVSLIEQRVRDHQWTSSAPGTSYFAFSCERIDDLVRERGGSLDASLEIRELGFTGCEPMLHKGSLPD